MPDIQRPPYLTRKQASAYLCVSVPTLARWASHKTGPRYFRLGRNARYLQEDLGAFIEARLAVPPSLARVHYSRRLRRVLSAEDVGRLIEAAPEPAQGGLSISYGAGCAPLKWLH